MMFKRLFNFLPLVCALPFSAAVSATVLVEQPQVRLMPPGVPNTAGYMTLTSEQQDDALLAARCDGVRTTELHTILEEDGLTKMRPVSSVALPQGQAVALTPGGYHLMLMGVDGLPAEGETLRCELTFERAGPQSVGLVATPIGEESKDDHHHHHHH
ncbi:copper chaperone PCu(A)C [Ferrimonas marina]|uniref:Copper(I)-binding protein n=1 Tax=Ferrimonas marina TaxID=299255 RepID=A0A1M5X6B2_9GAMM|nr:copper chaperone PCu(A)C [Ferrimonas marina]SHH95182.1 hypothetical protein SAMN02745129_3255 [Ferrimonas marina]